MLFFLLTLHILKFQGKPSFQVFYTHYQCIFAFYVRHWQLHSKTIFICLEDPSGFLILSPLCVRLFSLLTNEVKRRDCEVVFRSEQQRSGFDELLVMQL